MSSKPRLPPTRILRRLLRVPLFYKILIANAVIVLIGTIGGFLLARVLPRTPTEFPAIVILAFAAAGVLATVLVNAFIVRVALSPLKLLEGTAREVQAGNLDARVPYSPLRDRELERLTGIFNGMLDTLESYQHRLSGVAARAVNAEEQERKRIARELHDDTAQSLAALLIRLRLLRGVQEPESRDEMLEEFRKELGEALERVRRFARGLRPPALDELGLIPAIESHVRSLSESVGITMRVEAEPLEERLSQPAELALYRIAQEAISNAVRHANPSRVVVRIKQEDGAVVLTVTDDGSGFRVDRAMSTEESGLGLFGMRERASYFGGTVTVRSAPGKGTEVRAVIPISATGSRIPAESHDTGADVGGGSCPERRNADTETASSGSSQA